MKYKLYLFLILTLISCSETDAPVERWWTEGNRSFILSELDRTSAELAAEIDLLTIDQWHFREEEGSWSIAEIVEHLEMQNQLHYREITVVANAPQYLEYRAITEGQDQYFIDYATDAAPGQAQWFLEPIGRFDNKELGAIAFFRARGKLREFVAQTQIDLRKQFTFRTTVEGKEVSELSIGEVRDLHQLLLTGIAHTDRHLAQIKEIKQHKDYPNN